MLKQFKQLKSFAQDPLSFITNQRKEQGDFFTVNLGIKKIHFACHPKYAKAILGIKADQFQKSRLIFDKIRPITGRRGLVQLENDEWVRMRKITNDIFQRQYMARYLEMMIYYIDKECERIDESPVINIMPETHLVNNANVNTRLIQKKIDKVIAFSWLMATTEDKRAYQNKKLRLRILHFCLDRLYQLCVRSEKIHLKFLRKLHGLSI